MRRRVPRRSPDVSTGRGRARPSRYDSTLSNDARMGRRSAPSRRRSGPVSRWRESVHSPRFSPPGNIDCPANAGILLRSKRGNCVLFPRFSSLSSHIPYVSFGPVKKGQGSVCTAGDNYLFGGWICRRSTSWFGRGGSGQLPKPPARLCRGRRNGAACALVYTRRRRRSRTLRSARLPAFD